jgi:hypothetical protein
VVEFNDGVVVEEDVIAAGCEEVDQFAPRLVFGDGDIAGVFDRWEAVAVVGVVVVVVMEPFDTEINIKQ